MEYEIQIEANPNNSKINALDLADFLQKFRAIYVVALAFIKYEQYENIELSDSEYSKIEESFHRYLFANRGSHYLRNFTRRKLEPELELEFSSISTNSPIKFGGYCVGISLLALSLSVSIAGGTADLKNKKFLVNSLAGAVVEIMQELKK